ncbi:MAG: hypothetical protein CO098_12345, partial [Bacteroidetes bacterium CG_4_9_14_3_um_filter_41_19]
MVKLYAKFIPTNLTRYLFIGVINLFFVFSTFAQDPTLVASSEIYCEGQNGVTLSVNNAVVGQTYELWSGPNTWSLSSSASVTAVSSSFDFSGTWPDNLYELRKGNTHYSPIIEIKKVNEYIVTITDNGVYCAGESTGPIIGLSESQGFVTYNLYRDGVFFVESKTGNPWGGALEFGTWAGFQTAGIYTVEAVTSECTIDMNGSVEIIVSDPQVSFVYTEASSPNCGTVTFTSTVSGGIEPYQYEWTFNDGTPNSTEANPIHQFASYGNASEDFTVELAIIDASGCNTLITEVVGVTQRPHASLDPPIVGWSYCDSDPLAIFICEVTNSSTTTATNSSYTINWGDGLIENFTPAEFPFEGTLQHTYFDKGTFILEITVVGNNGCQDVREYPVFNGSTPAGGLTYDQGILEGCLPHTINFYLSADAASNPPTTSYYFDFGDGEDSTFYQENMPDTTVDGRFIISHTYTLSSCDEPNNSYTLESLIVNPCTPQGIDNNIGGIKISRKSSSDFLRAEFPYDPIYLCVGVDKIFTSNTNLGCIIYGATGVIDVTNYYWDFYNDGTYESTEENPTFSFPSSGTYEVRLKTHTGEGIPGNCGADELIRTVCVQDVPIADFSLSENSICLDNAIFSPINNSVFTPPNCSQPNYQWIVNPNQGFTYDQGTNAYSEEPVFNFTQVGEYTIQLRALARSGYSVCADDYSDPINLTIKGDPQVTIDPDAGFDLCGGGSVDITVSQVSYDANFGTISGYLWTVDPAGPSITNPNDDFPTIIFPDATQDYVVSVAVTNECGTTQSDGIPVSVTQSVSNNTISYAGGTTLCSGMTLEYTINGTVVPTLAGGDGTYAFSWFIDTGAGWIELAGQTGANLIYSDPLSFGTTSFKREVTSGHCIDASNTLTFNILPGIDNNNISSDQDICNNSIPAALVGSVPTQGDGTYTFLWEESTDNVTWIDATGVNTDQNFTPPALAQTTYYRRNVFSDVCESVSNAVTIQVNEYPDINSADNIFSCSGEPLAYYITSSVPLTTYTWTVTDNSAGLITGYSDASGDLIDQTLVNSGSSQETITYTITPTGPETTFCVGNTFDLIVTVNPQFTTTYDDMIVNMGTYTTLIGAVTGGTGNFTYSWVSNPAGNFTSATDIANPQTGNITVPTDYTLTLSDEANCQFVQTITVTPDGDALNVSISCDDIDNTVCDGTVITLIANASGGNGTVPSDYSYVWTNIPVGAVEPNDWTRIFPAVDLGITTYSVEIDDSFNTATGDITIQVNEYPQVTSLPAAFVCDGEDLNYLIESSIGLTTFVWTATDNSGGNISGFADGSGSAIVQTLYNAGATQQTITYTIIPTGPEPTNCEGAPYDLTVTVNPEYSSTYGNATINMGTATTITGSLSGGNGNYSYGWTSNPPNMINGATDIANPLTVNLSSPVDYTLVAHDDQNCEFTQTITITPTGNGLSVTLTSDDSDNAICQDATVVLTATANGGNGGGDPTLYTYNWIGLPSGAVFIQPWIVSLVPDALAINTYTVEANDGFNTVSSDIIITVEPAPMVTSGTMAFVCSGEDLDYLIESNIAQSTYTWTATDNSGGQIVGFADGSGSQILQNLTNSSLSQETVTFTIIPTGPAPTLCEGDPFDLVVTVNPQFNTTYTDMTINMGTSTTIAGAITGGMGNYAYSWTSNPAGHLVGDTDIANPATDLLFFPVDFTLNLTDDEGCTYSQTITITPQGQLLTVDITSDDADNIICDGATIVLTANASGGNGSFPEDYTYTWTGLPASVIYLEEWMVSLIPPQDGTYNYQVEISDQFTLADAQISIVVDPKPIIISTNLMMVCSGENVNYTPVADVPGTTFTWTSLDDPASCVTGNTLAGVDFIDDILVNNCNLRGTVSYTIIPTGPAPTFCVGDPFTFTAAVNPVTHITNTITEETILTGEFSTRVEFETDIVGIQPTFQWTGVASDPAVSGWVQSGTGDLVEMQLFIDNIPTAPDQASVTYTVTPFANGCAGEDFTYTINILSIPSPFNLAITGSNEICDDGNSCVDMTLDGSQVGVNYQLFIDGMYVNGSDKLGTGSPLSWCYGAAGIYTAIGTNLLSGVSVDMTGSAEVITRPQPTEYTLTYLQPGDNCLPIIPHLVGSDANATYELNFEDYNGFYYPAIETLNGTGAPLDFGIQIEPGYYSVVATIDYGNIFCVLDMNGTLVADSVPKQFDSTPQGTICENTEDLCLLASEPGIDYQLWLNNQPVGAVVPADPTGGSICFGQLAAPGIYRIHAINPVSGCEIFFEEEVLVNPQPIVYLMSPEEACAGSDIILNGCEDGIAYYLYVEPATKQYIEVLGPLFCNEGIVNFGPQNLEGVYRIKAVNPLTNCDIWMDGTTTILASPEVFAVSPQAGGCAPVEIYLEDFELDAIYYLYRDTELVATDDGLDGSVNFGQQSQIGLYTVKAQIIHPSGLQCWSNMQGTVEIYNEAQIFSLLPQGPVCPDVSFHLSGSEANVEYNLWSTVSGLIETVSGTGGVINFSVQSEPGDYWVVAATITGCETQMDGLRTISETPDLYTMIPIGQWCENEPVAITLPSSQVGITYQLFRDNSSSNPLAEEQGTGSALNFGIYSDIGTYSIKGIHNTTSCERWMEGQLIINAQPNVYSVTANGAPAQAGWYCPPVEIGLSFSQVSIQYTLTLPDGTQDVFIGDGSALVFGDYSQPGTYTVKAINTTTYCEADMTGTINVYEQPVAYDFIAQDVPPVYCSDDLNAITLLLSSSQLGVLYQLLKDGNEVGTPLPGNNGLLTWQNVSQYGFGQYTVEASFASDPFCSSTMNGTIDVAEIESPIASLTGIAYVCENATCTQMEITLTGLQITEIVYTDGIQNFTLVLDPAMSPHSIEVCPIQTTVYQLVSAQYTAEPFCMGAVSGDFTVDVNPLPQVFAGNPATTCVNVPITLTEATSTNSSSVQWTIESGNGILDDYNILNPTYTPDPLDQGTIVVLKITAFGTNSCTAEETSSTVEINIDPLPIAYAGSDLSSCISMATVQLTEATAQNASSVLWQHDGAGALNSVTAINPVYTPQPADEGQVITFTMTAFGQGQCIGEKSIASMTILFNSMPIVDAGTGGSICASESIDLLGTAQDYSTVLWSVDQGSGTFSDNAQLNTTFQPDEVNVVTVMTLKLTAFGTEGCITDFVEDFVDVTVVPAPVIFAGSNDTICDLEPYHLNQATVTNAVSLEWLTLGTGTFNDEFSINPTYTPTSEDLVAGSVDLILTATNPNCSGIPDTMTLFFGDVPIVAFNALSQACQGTDLLFEDLSSTNIGTLVKWEWDFGDGAIIVINSPDNPDVTHTYLNPANYIATLTVTTSLGCEASISNLIEIFPGVNADFLIVNDGDCANAPIQFSDQSTTSGLPITNWLWNFGDPGSGSSNLSTDQNPEHAFSLGGDFDVTLIVIDENGCSDTVVKTVNTLDSPMALFTHNPISPSSCQNTEVQFTDLSTSASSTITEWVWNFGDGSPDVVILPPDDPNLLHVFPASGSYSVLLKVTNALGCVDTFLQTINVTTPLFVVDFNYTIDSCLTA